MGRSIEQQAEIALAHGRVSYTLHRVSGRRHVHLVLGEDGALQVRAPYRFSLAEAEGVIRRHAAWVTRALRSAEARHAGRLLLASGVQLPFVDELLQLELRRGGRARVRRIANVLHVFSDSHEAARLRTLLVRWYREQARAYLGDRLETLAAPLGVRPSRLSIRAQRTRWGSCSARGAISLNWRLMLLPSELSDYVLVHELCHLCHLNHSASFWKMVAEVIPDHRERSRRLRAAQTALVL